MRAHIALLALLVTGSAFADSGSEADDARNRCLERATKFATVLSPAASRLAGAPINPRLQVCLGCRSHAFSDLATNKIIVGAACTASDAVIASTVAHELGHFIPHVQGIEVTAPKDGELRDWLVSDTEINATAAAIRMLKAVMPEVTFTPPSAAFNQHVAAAAAHAKH